VAITLPATLKTASFHDGRPVAWGEQRVDGVAVRRRTDEQLKTCSGKVVLALEDDYPSAGRRASFVTDILDPCWRYENAPVGGATRIALEVGQLPFNFQIGKDIEQIRFPAPATPEGEFEVRAGTCQGPRVAVLPLAGAAGDPGVTRLVGALDRREGNETLCIRYTARGVEPMWALKSVELIP
jgi:hexosaminidase